MDTQKAAQPATIDRRQRPRPQRKGEAPPAASKALLFSAGDQVSFARLAAEIDCDQSREAEATQGHLRLGRNLSEIRRRGLHRLDDVPDFWQWAKARFGYEKNQVRRYMRVGRELPPELVVGYRMGLAALTALCRVPRAERALRLARSGPQGTRIEARMMRGEARGERKASLQDCLHKLDQVMARQAGLLSTLQEHLAAGEGEALDAAAMSGLLEQQEALRARLCALAQGTLAAPSVPVDRPPSAAGDDGEAHGEADAEVRKVAPDAHVPVVPASAAAPPSIEDPADPFTGLLDEVEPQPSRRAHAPLAAVPAPARRPPPRCDLGHLRDILDPLTLAALDREAEESSGAPKEALTPKAESPSAPPIEDGEEYTPLPPPPGPPLALPPRFHDPDYPVPIVATAAVAGDGDLTSFGLLGLRYKSWEPLGQSYEKPFASGFFGVPGSGKSYGLGALIEGALQPQRGLNHLKRPMCAISLHYHPAASYEPELLAGVDANPDDIDAAVLTGFYRGLPAGLRDILALVLPEQVVPMRRLHPSIQVHGIRFALRELGIDGLRILLGLHGEPAPHYARQVEALLRQLDGPLTWNRLVRAIRAFPFDRRARNLIAERLWQVRPWIDDRHELRDFLRPGRLIQIDLRGDLIAKEQAMTLFALCVRVLALNASTRAEGTPPLLVIYDEAHKFTKVPLLRQQLETLIRERRHLDLSVAVASQDPPSLPGEIISLLDGIGVYRHESAEWARHLGRCNGAFSKLPVSATAALPPGLMWYWARTWQVVREGWEEPEGPILIAARPRASRHGG